MGGEGGSWGGDQVLWKPSGVVVQVAGLVTVPGGSWGGDLVFLKLSGLECRWQDLLQHLEEVGVETRSCGSFQG